MSKDPAHTFDAARMGGTAFIISLRVADVKAFKRSGLLMVIRATDPPAERVQRS